MTVEDELKTALAKGSVLIGTRSVAKALKTGELKKAVLAKNCPEAIKKDIYHYAQLSKVQVEEFSGTAKQLGIFCGKPFSVTTLAII